MAYQTGSSTGVNDLLTKLATFLTGTCGYTANSNTTDGAGRKLLVTKGSKFFNFKSYVNESVPGYGVTHTGIFMNGSTNYNGSNPWYDQPGAMTYNDGSTKYFMAGMINITGSIPTYHFFYYTSADYEVIYVFVEAPSGTFQRLCFGRLSTANYGTSWTGINGVFFQGSKSPASTTLSLALNLFGTNGGGTGWSAEAPQGAVYGIVGGVTQWMSGNWTLAPAYFSPSRVQTFDSISRQSTIWLNTPNSVNTSPVMFPIQIGVTKDTVNSPNSTTRFAWVGSLPFMYWTNIYNLVPGSFVTIGSDQYVIFPFTKKSDTWIPTDSTNGTYRFGLLVKK